MAKNPEVLEIDQDQNEETVINETTEKSAKKPIESIFKRSLKNTSFKKNKWMWSSFTWALEVPQKPHYVRCKYCSKICFSVKAMGSSALVRHEKSQCHDDNVKKKRKEIQEQPVLEKDLEGNMKVKKPAETFNIDPVLKAEILWCFKVVQANFSFNSCENISNLFREMFLDSEVSKKFHMGRTKSTYLLNYGIATYLRNILIQDVKGCPFAYSFDETGTIQKKKQYDCYVRYNSKALKKVVTRYVSSELMGHCKAKDLSMIFFKKIGDLQLDLNFMLHIQSDFPNVNKSFIAETTNKIRKEFNKEPVLSQSCVLHPVHTYFMKALDKITFKYDEFCQDLHSFFKYSPARIEDYHLSSLITDTDCENMKRHVNTRWLSLGPVLKRIYDQWDNLCNYFLKYLLKNGDKDVLGSSRYLRIKSILAEDPLHTKICLQFASYLAATLEDIIMRPFQSKAPTIHLFYPAMSKLFYVLMSNVLKKDKLTDVDAQKLSRIDLSKEALTYQNVHYGSGVDFLLSDTASLTGKQKISVEKLKTEMRNCYLFLIDSLREKLPVQSFFIKCATAIDPSNRFKQETAKSLSYLAKKVGESLKNTLKCSVQEFTDRVHTEFQLFVSDKEILSDFERLDVFWWSVADRNDDSYKNMCNLAFSVMVLTVTNVDAERGFSINKDILDGRSTMSENTLTSIRLVKDFILHYDNDLTKISEHITPELLKSCSKAYNSYAADKKAKKDLAELEKRNQEKKAKELEQLKVKDQQSHLKAKKNLLKMQLASAKELLRAGHEKVDLGLKTNSQSYCLQGNASVKEALKRIDEIELELETLSKEITDL